MSNPYFRFKQFTVWHDQCAMKVGTDGVLLGAWANADNSSTLLDIGTGSGLIALMLAQRYPQMHIQCIDIDKAATIQAADNFSKSDWSTRLQAIHISLEQFASACTMPFDVIVSNPPYFQQSLHSPDEQRTTARHTTQLTYDSLLHHSRQLLSEDGSLHLILPVAEAESLLENLPKHKLFCHRKTYVHPTPEAPPKRLLITLKKKSGDIQQNSLVIESGIRHHYTQEYIQLTRDFYLKM